MRHGDGICLPESLAAELMGLSDCPAQRWLETSTEDGSATEWAENSFYEGPIAAY